MAVGYMEPTSPFLWGAGGRKLTPEEIAAERARADALMAGGVDTSPVGHWMEGLARVAQAGAGAYRNYRAGKAERENADWTAEIAKSVLNSFGGGTADPVATALVAPSASSPAGGARAASGGPSVLPASFLAGVDRTEGGGDYNTLYGHAQRGGRSFAGTNVSDMTIGQALAFAAPGGSYAQNVKGQIGRVATPMGRHQIVGKTLRNAAAEMGLSMDTPFNAQTQDAIALHLAKKRLAGASTLDGKIDALRSEWHGFKGVPRSQMAQIVADLERSPAVNRMSPEQADVVRAASVPQPAPMNIGITTAQAMQPVQVASLDPSAGLPTAGPVPTPRDMVAELTQSVAAQPPARAAQPDIQQQVTQALMQPSMLAQSAPMQAPGLPSGPVAQAQSMPMPPVPPMPMMGPGEYATGLVPPAGASQMVPPTASVPVNLNGLPYSNPPVPTSRDEIVQQLSTTLAAQTPQQPPSPVVQALAASTPPPPRINPAIIEALSDPRAPAHLRQLGNFALQHQMAQHEAAQERYLAEQQTAAELARRKEAATRAGVDPNLALDPELWKAGVADRFRAPPAEQQNLAWRAREAGLQPGTPEYVEFMLSGGSQPTVPDSFQALALRAQAAGLQPGTPEYQSFMAMGGRSPEDSAAAQRIARMTENLMATGDFIDPREANNIAVGIVDGRLKADRHPITGELQVVDMATGRAVYGGRAQAAAPTLPAPETPMTPADQFGRQFPASGESFGVPGAIAGGINRVTDAIGVGPVYPDIQQTQADFGVLRESLLNDIASAYNRQPPSWLLEEIRGLTPAAGSVFEGPAAAQSKMNAIGRHLTAELAGTERALKRDLSPENRQKLEAQRAGLQMGIDRVTGALQSFKTPEPPASPDASSLREGQTATNPQTGERIIYRGGQWEPLQ